MRPSPENIVMATGPKGEQKPRKMRASCDACSRAKVKCDKVRPTCHRCGNMGICCNYSPSMRLGKPRKNRNPDGTIMRDVSPANACGPMAPRLDMIPRTSNTYTAESSPEPADPFFFGPATPEYHYQDAFMANGFDGGHSPASYSETGSVPSGWSNEDQMMFGSPADVYTPIPQFPTTAPSYAGHVRSTSSHSQAEMYTQMGNLTSQPLVGQPFYPVTDPMFTHDKMVTTPPPMVPAPLPTPPISVTSQSHDCTQFAFQTLNSLYAPPSSQPPANGFGGGLEGLPTLDAVLSTNKSAVDKLYVLLNCPCSANPHFSTTIAFTVTKILSWYQAIAGVNDQEDSSANTQMEAFIHTPISLGDFRLEVEDEDTFRTQLVLGELRKVEKLIDKFSERYCKNANSTETGIDGSVYGALEQLLRTRVRDTFKITMRTAPQDVKRQVASRSQNRARFNTL
ncbi:hypothetical protein GQ44DRAFT_611294 [Phaeosphaeriaceae sp. PMI808]|nr:hypothetical protein GQ44DRAFT_611294 [Phaeosphaeriaceae sp. PMI808]